MLYYTRIFICHERSLRRTSDNNCQCLLSLAQEPRQHETESEGKKGEDTRTKEAQTTKPCFVVCALGASFWFIYLFFTILLMIILVLLLSVSRPPNFGARAQSSFRSQ